MADDWNNFLTSATNLQLKNVLRKLNQSTSGNKATLILRLQRVMENYTSEELAELVRDELNSQNGFEDDDSDEVIEENYLNNEQALDENIQRLQRLVEKKRKIFELKKELASLQNDDLFVANNSQSALYNFKDIEDTLPKFSCDDNLQIQRWIELFEEATELLNYDERTKFLYSKRLLSRTTKLFTRTISLKTWDDLKHALISEFSRKVTKADVHEQLRLRKKKRDETLQQYVLSMQEIAVWGKIDEQDLVQYVIKGVQDNEMNKMILYAANSLNELKIALMKYEK